METGKECDMEKLKWEILRISQSIYFHLIDLKKEHKTIQSVCAIRLFVLSVDEIVR